MESVTSSSAMQHALWFGAAVVGGLAVTLFFSLVRPYIDSLLADVAARMREARIGVLAAATRVVSARFSRFLNARCREPWAPVVSELSRLSSEVEAVGLRQVDGLREIEQRISVHVSALQTFNAPERPVDTDPRQIVEAVSGTSVIGLITLALLSVVMGLVNASLLGIFFVEVIGPESIFKYPLPNIPRGYVLAGLMFMIEVASGWAIFRSGVRAQRAGEQQGAGAVFFRAAPWVLLFALAIVELAAYSLLSQRVELARRLGVEPSSPMYGLAQYFLAFLGLGLTLLLAYLGHAIAEGLDERRRSKVARDLVRAVKRGKSTAVQQAERLKELLGSCVEVARGMPASVPEEFQRGLGTQLEKEAVLQTTKRAIVVAVASAELDETRRSLVEASEPSQSIRVRTDSQVWADFFLNILFLAILVAVFVLTSAETLDYLGSGLVAAPTVVLWAIALALPAAIVGMAAVTWNVLKGLRFASPATAALPERRGRVVLGWVLVVALVVSDLLLAGELAASAGPSRSAMLFGLLGLLQGIALVAFTGWLDRGLLACAHGIYLAGLGVVEAGAYLVAGFALLVQAIAYLVRVLIRLIAVPGDMIRRRPLSGSEEQLARSPS